MAAGDYTITYQTQQQPTFALASLASSASLLAGYATGIITNTTNKFTEYQPSGFVTVGTSPTANTVIEIWSYAQNEATPAYPDVFDGSAGAKTITSAGIKNSMLKLVVILDVDATTSDRKYYFGPESIRAAYGGTVPENFGFFVTHNTGVVLNATAGNHQLNVLPVLENIAQS